MTFSGIQTLTVCFIKEAGESLSPASTGEERHRGPRVFAHSTLTSGCQGREVLGGEAGLAWSSSDHHHPCCSQAA